MMPRLLQYYVRHFPLNKGKSRVISLLWKPLSSGERRQEATLRQARVRVSCDLGSLIQRQLYFWGSYESDYCAHWIRLVKRAKVVFDIGANVGLYSLLAAATNSQAQIHAFDPAPDIVDKLKTNIDLNGFRNINVNAMAVGSRCGAAMLRECRGSDGTNEGMSFVPSNGGNHEPSDRPISMISVDEYCLGRGIDQIDLMKMDIEGGEYDALLGARNLLDAKAIRCLFLETAEWAARRSGHSTIDVGRLLIDRGYRLYRLKKSALVEVTSQEIPNGENVIAFATLDLVRSAHEAVVAPGSN